MPQTPSASSPPDMRGERRPHVVVIGAGFTGLAAAYELGRRNVAVTVLESEKFIGGLAAGYEVGGEVLERFYHHWLGTDRDIVELIAELGQEDKLVRRSTRTGMYYANNIYRLSRPLDVLRFTPLSFVDRLRLGLLVARSWTVRDFHGIEHLTARDWLIATAGKKVYEVVWEPLLVGKFGRYADSVGAVWLWNKFIQRGKSRGRTGGEELVYYRGGFAAMLDDWARVIREGGARIRLGEPVRGLVVGDGAVTGVTTDTGTVAADAVIATPALPLIADLMEPAAPPAYIAQLRSIAYLANICLVLQLKRSLSETYWLNVNDPSFPFVGIIEHTNFEPAGSYDGRHIVYMSKYLPRTDRLYQMPADELLEFCVPYIQKMFPEFRPDWIIRYDLWRADYAQPVITPNYSKVVPSVTTPLRHLFISTMAHVYPQDRGTNYSIRHGREVGAMVAEELRSSS